MSNKDIANEAIKVLEDYVKYNDGSSLAETYLSDLRDVLDVWDVKNKTISVTVRITLEADVRSDFDLDNFVDDMVVDVKHYTSGAIYGVENYEVFDVTFLDYKMEG